jgi:chromosome segregation ATPase
MSMTPERIEELKGRFKDVEPEELTFISVGELNDLLAALEESQQRASKWEKAYENADRGYLQQEKRAGDLMRQLVEAQQQLTDSLERERGLKYLCNQSFEEKERANRELVEAQQTIARQEEALEFYEEPGNYLEHIIGWGPKIPVLQDGGKRAYAALGNKEGSDKA